MASSIDTYEVTSHSWYVSINGDALTSTDPVLEFTQDIPSGRYTVTCALTVIVNDPEFERPLVFHPRCRLEYTWDSDSATLEEVKE